MMPWNNGAEAWSPAMKWLVAGGSTATVLIVLMTLRRLVRRRREALLAKGRIDLLELPFEVLARTSLAFVLAVSVYVGQSFLQVPGRVARILDTVTVLACFWQLGLWLTAAFKAWLERKRRHSLEFDRASVGSINVIGLVMRALIWVIVTLLALDNLGVNITALVAGLGIGGVAVALALQNILGDLFASLAIALDKPFVVGDFLSLGDLNGTVENIGLKSTRVRSLTGEQVVVSNADLLRSRVRNFGRMQERRTDFVLNLTYGTEAEKLAEVPGVVRRIVEAQPCTRFERCHFAELGAHSLDFSCAYYVLSADYLRHMEVRQAINLAILREFRRLGIEFAYPTMTLVHEAR